MRPQEDQETPFARLLKPCTVMKQEELRTQLFCGIYPDLIKRAINTVGLHEKVQNLSLITQLAIQLSPIWACPTLSIYVKSLLTENHWNVSKRSSVKVW